MERMDGLGQHEVSLGEVGAAVNREWKTALFIFLGTVLVAGLLGWVWPTSYAATATVAVQPLSLDPTGTRASELNIATEQVIVTSRQVATEAATTLGIDDVRDLQDRTTVTIPQDSSALEITVTAPKAEDAAEAANAFATAYLDYRRAAAADLADSISQGIDAQISTLLASLTSESSNQMRISVSQQIADLRSEKSALTGTSIKPGDIVSRAVAPRSPASPGLPLFLAAGIALGALLAFGGALARDRLNPSVHSAARLSRHIDCRILDGRRHDAENLPRQVSLILDAFRQDTGLRANQAPSVVIATAPGRSDPLEVMTRAAKLPRPVRVMSERGAAGVAEAVGKLPRESIFALMCRASDRWDEVTAMTEAMAEWGRAPSLVVIAPDLPALPQVAEAEAEPAAPRAKPKAVLAPVTQEVDEPIDDLDVGLPEIRRTPRSTSPRPTGPRLTGPRTTGPRLTGPRTTGPRTTGPRTTCPSAKPQPRRADSAGESAPGLLERRPPVATVAAASLVVGARARLGHLRDQRRALLAGRRGGDLGVPSHHPQPAQRAAQPEAGLRPGAPVPARPGRLDGRRGGVPVLRGREAARRTNGVRRGVRPHRPPHAHRGPVLSAHGPLRGPVARAGGHLSGRRGRRMADLSPILLVTMGTDHHRFDRLSGWVESWLERTGPTVVCRVQQGASAVPAGAQALGLLPREEFLAEMAASSVIVCQGGPGSILDARSLGFVPIAVPRLAALDEVVDDHQVSFTRRMSEQGWAVGVESEDALHRALDQAMADPASLRRPPAGSTAADTADRFADLLDAAPARGVRWHRLPRAARLAARALRGIRVGEQPD